MTMHVRVGGTHREVTGLHVKVAGVHRPIKEGWVKVAGTWRQFYALVSSVLALTNRSIVALNLVTTCVAGARFSSGGGLSERRNANYTNISGEWATEAVTGGDYEIYAENISSSGVSSSTGTFNTWLSLSSNREWTISRSTVGDALRTIRFTIRKISDHSDSVTADISLQASRG